ncbi:metallophosphoesterase [Helicobacter turcicus]|uniref:Metallophosphoesterase n=1 Tax=Helicobacter turcicus TaxID=2867412 RepID=A0ABS7JL95_9HELI|nr:metallophosphoesterase [Helicobacter turcicus]MBX7490136.1 metallophosphoesterase [Helicobacter turcicus]MBX7544994.1 metallophosphoesterase [Helicobacter turcicus]
MKNLFPIIFLLVFFGFHIGIYFFFIKQIVKTRIPLKILKYFLVFNFFGVVLYFSGRYFVDLPQSVYFLVSLSIGVGFVLFVVMLLYQTLSLILRFIGILFPKFSQERRGFLQNSLNIASGIFALGYLGFGLVEGRLSPVVERVRILLNGFRGKMTAVQISDLHIGGLIEENVVGEIVAQVNALKPDFIVLTGDIVDTEISKVPEAINALTRLEAPLGVYFILGNHEYFHSISPLLNALKSKGIVVLENDCVLLQKGEARLNLAGVYDIFGRRINALEPNLEEALQKRIPHFPLILLAHQPKFALEIKEEHNVDLILSGHTHGGQIFPFSFLVRLEQPYLKGLYQHGPKTQIYVNRGTGFWGPPMRILARAEITYFEFVST